MEKLPLDTIIRAVADQADMSVDLLKGRAEHHGHAVKTARQRAWLMLWRLRPDTSLQAIGNRFDRRNHATIYHGIQALELRLNAGDAYDAAMLQLTLRRLGLSELPPPPARTRHDNPSVLRHLIATSEARLARWKARLAELEGAAA